MSEETNIKVETGIGKIEYQYGDIYFNKKEIFKPSIEWAKEKIELSLKSIGNRYITYNNEEYEDLNQKVYLSKYINNINSLSYDEFIKQIENDKTIHVLKDNLFNIIEFVKEYNELKNNVKEQNLFFRECKSNCVNLKK